MYLKLHNSFEAVRIDLNGKDVQIPRRPIFLHFVVVFFFACFTMPNAVNSFFPYHPMFHYTYFYFSTHLTAGITLNRERKHLTTEKDYPAKSCSYLEILSVYSRSRYYVCLIPLFSKF